MKKLASVSMGAMIALSIVTTQAKAQSYTATKVFDADSTMTTGTMGLGGHCISNCLTVSTTYTPLGLSDSDVAYASQDVSQSYGVRNVSLRVWNNGPQSSAQYALYPGDWYHTASNAGAIPTLPGGNFVPPISGAMSFLNGVSNSGRLLAGGYDPALPHGFLPPNQALVPSVSNANDLYVSAVGGTSWSKVIHDASLTNLNGEDVNNDGRVVGYSIDAAGHSQAFFTTDNGGTLQLLNTTGASDTAFASINDRGVAVGVMVSNADKSFHVFTYDTQSGALTDLGLEVADLGGPALKINDAGQIVQGSRVYDPISHAWVLPVVTGPSDRWTFADINNRGDILAKSASGVYILQAVPEPSTLLMTGLGLVGIGCVSRKKQQRQITSVC